MSLISVNRNPSDLVENGNVEKAIKQNFSNDDDDEGEEIF